MKTLKITAAAAALIFTLGACGSDATSTDADAAATTGDVRATDVSHIKKVDEIAALLPESVTADGTLTFGTNAFYAPAEFYAEDGTTLQGFDIDLAHALGQVLGLKVSIKKRRIRSRHPRHRKNIRSRNRCHLREPRTSRNR